MPEFRIIGADLVHHLLPYDECIPLMRRAFLAEAEGRALQPIRQAMLMPSGKGLLSMMPGVVSDPDWLGIKVISVFPGNFGTDLGSHQGPILLFDPDNGRLMAMIDGREVTAIRTAAASAAATDALANPDAASLGIFGYGEQATQIALAVEDLTIKPGEKVALLGRNGAGKSTLLQGLSGLLDPIEGEVLIDGLNLAQVDPADARRAIGYVSSSARLFHGTIRENLTLGARFADDQQIMAALQLVRADQFVARLTAGLDHRLQEGGLGLSGGQVQALLLARMLIREPSVLLLDEPSAAMDDETERHFVTQFAAWSKGRTVVIATHRTRLLDLVDRVIVLNNGRIAADQSKARFLAMHGAGQQVSSGQAASVVKS